MATSKVAFFSRIRFSLTIGALRMRLPIRLSRLFDEPDAAEDVRLYRTLLNKPGVRS